MKRISILFAMGGIMRRAGAETVTMRYIREIVNNKKFKISVLVHGFGIGDYDEELNALGISIYHVPVRGKNLLTYNAVLNDFFYKHNFDIVHCNMDMACGDFLEVAKRNGVKIRIAHAHSTNYQSKNPLRVFNSYLSKCKIPKVATNLIACSRLAGKWMYNNNDFIIIKNALNLDEYKPNLKIREAVRLELQIKENDFVIGHVGRFEFEKNHDGLIRFFKEYNCIHKNSILVCVGDGSRKRDVEKTIKLMQLTKNVRFLGVRNDVQRIMQAFDVFVLPSLFEGLPLVGIEAQATGLPCIFSNKITSEVCIGDKCYRLPLEEKSEWVKCLEKINGEIVNYNFNKIQLRGNGYDIKEEAAKLMDFYCECVTNKR